MAELDKRLIARTGAKANGENVLFWRDYRVTVLQERLFRLEKNAKKIFRDEATQSVWFRDFGKIPFEATEQEGALVIKTNACSLVLRKNRRDCTVLLDGKELPVTNDGNLKGTYRTLDQCNGDTWSNFVDKKRKIHLGNGVCSTTGVAVFDDGKSLTLGEDGAIKCERGAGRDEYIFAYGNDYRSALRAFYAVTGSVPLIPRFALGNWWSRYYAYSDESYLTLMNKFEERRVPFSVAAVDMDWHYSIHVDKEKRITELGRNGEEYGGNNGWTGYSWNKNLFPDHKAFLSELKKRKLKVMLNLHPADGVRWWEDSYAEMANAMGVDVESLKPVEFDIANPQFINAYFKILHHPHERDGVDFWWVDWQQGQKSKMEGLDPLFSLNHYHYLDNPNGLILSRYAGIGSHRYPVGFSGDTVISWATLRYLTYFTQTATNIGYVWWSHDIGGHMLGANSFELYLRNVQFGVFSPINRFHCSDMQTLTKEPWAYGNGCGVIAEEWLRFRHQLIPFLYSRNYLTATQGSALIEPLYYKWGDCKEAYEAKGEYLFGDTFLVAPVLTPLAKDGYAYTRVWLPEGSWTDFFTGDKYSSPKGGRYITAMRRLESIPVFAQEGAIVPLSLDGGNGADAPKKLKVKVFEGNGEFTLYEDGANGQAFTQFTSRMKEEGGNTEQTLFIQATGDSDIIPQNRRLSVAFEGVETGEICVFEDGKKLPIGKDFTYPLTISFDFQKEKSYTIRAKYPHKDETQEFLARALKLLTESEDNNPNKSWHCSCQIEHCKSVADAVEIIKQSPIRECNKQRILEIL